ncbi:MAG: hypothetical protein HQL76_02160 [Magnetococcales bacterium]|nr:hypothetical protein [Magnetococcales bacterium]
MLRIVNLEEIQGLLLRIPSLVNLQEKKDATFVPEVKRWLNDVEKIFENNRLAIAGRIAVLRAELISAEAGILPARIVFHGRPTARKIRDATAAAALREASGIIPPVIEEDKTRFDGAERLGRQLVALARAKGIPTAQSNIFDHTERLKILWQLFRNDPDIAPGTVTMEGLVGPHDALVILDRTLTRDEPGYSTVSIPR